VLVLLGDGGVVVRDTVTNGHGEVGDGSAHHDDGGNDVVETLALLLLLESHCACGWFSETYNGDVP